MQRRIVRYQWSMRRRDLHQSQKGPKKLWYRRIYVSCWASEAMVTLGSVDCVVSYINPPSVEKPWPILAGIHQNRRSRTMCMGVALEAWVEQILMLEVFWPGARVYILRRLVHLTWSRLFLSMERVSLSISVIALVDCSRGELFIPGPSLGARGGRIRAWNRAFESAENLTGCYQVFGASTLLRQDFFRRRHRTAYAVSTVLIPVKGQQSESWGKI